MKLATTPEEQRAWMAQWRLAAVTLEQVKAEELMAMSEEEAAAASQDLLSLGPFPLPKDRQHSSGMVEQQQWFGKWHRLH